MLGTIITRLIGIVLPLALFGSFGVGLARASLEPVVEAFAEIGAEISAELDR